MNAKPEKKATHVKMNYTSIYWLLLSLCDIDGWLPGRNLATVNVTLHHYTRE